MAVLFSHSAKSQCQSSFTYIDNGSGNFSFTNTSTGNFLSYYWTFGDGNNAYTLNSANTYLTNGAYEVCLSIFDSISQCQSTFCDSILVTSAASCSLNTPYYTIDSICNFYFTANNNGANYFWDFGDGNNSNLQNPVHNYTNNGWYYYCLTVDSCPPICDSIYVGCATSQPCNLNQPQYFDSLCYFNFFSNNSGSSYFWDFGDGNFSNQQDPIHGYTSTGWYYYCLTVDSCTPICDSIYVNCTASSIEDNISEGVTSFNVFPNPIKNTATIEFTIENYNEVEVYITNIIGEKVDLLIKEEMSPGKKSLKWNASDLSNGVYLFTIKTNSSLEVKKLVLNR